MCLTVFVVPTFIAFLREVESPYEVQDYVKSYLGESAKSAKFANDFIEKRSHANKQRQRHDDEVSTLIFMYYRIDLLLRLYFGEC